MQVYTEIFGKQDRLRSNKEVRDGNEIIFKGKSKYINHIKCFNSVNHDPMKSI